MAYLIRPPARLKKAKSGNAKLILDRIESFISENQEEPVRILCGFWGDQQDAISYQELRAGVLAGRLDANTYDQWAQDYSTMVANKFAPVWKNALAAGSGSQPIMSTVLERSSSFRFDTSLPGSAKWIATHSADFVTRCSQQQKEAIQSLLSLKVVESHTVDELARFIRPCIGLTEAQSKAALKYYDTVKATLREQHPRMKAETIQTKAVKAASRYAERAHRYRAMTIAQTELASAYNKGADEGVRQAMDAGLLGTMAKVWSTSGDENVCETCAALDGVQVGMDDSFDYKGKSINSTMNARLLPPAHPRCACAIEYVEISPPTFAQQTQSIVEEDDGFGEHYFQDGVVSQERYEAVADDLADNGAEFTDKHVREMVDSIHTYTKADYTDILAAQTGFEDGRISEYSSTMDEARRQAALKDVSNINDYLTFSTKYEGETYRALGFDVGGDYDTGAYEQFRSMYKQGAVVKTDTFTSWSSDESFLKTIWSNRTFLDESCEYSVEVELRMAESKTGVDISKLAELESQKEVLFPQTELRVLKVAESWKNEETLRVVIDLEEVLPEWML